MPTKTSEETIERIRKLRGGPNPLPYEQVADISGVSVSTAYKYGSSALTELGPPQDPVVLLAGNEIGIVDVKGQVLDIRIPTPSLDFEVYDYDVFRNLHKKIEPQLYRLYKKEWTSNPFVSLLVEFILNEIFGDGFHFEGPGAEDVENFFKLNKTRKTLKLALRETIVYGNGFLGLTILNQQLTKLTVVPAISVTITLDEDGAREYSQVQTRVVDGQPAQTDKPLNKSNLIHFTIKELSDLPYGISLLRPNLHFLRSLLDVGGDIPAAIKRVAYSPTVALLDLEGYATDEEKETVVENYAKKLNKVASATSNYAIDKRHDLRLLNQGAAGAQQLNVVQLIEPILAVVLLNMGMPIGFFLQAASNRAVLREQREGIQRFIAELKSDIALEIESELVPRITGEEAHVVWELALSDQIRLGRALATYYRLGLISRQFFLDAMNIEDEGKDFFPVGPGGGGGDAGVGIPDPSRDDEQESELSDF